MNKYRLTFSFLLVCLALISVPAFSDSPEAPQAPAVETVEAPAEALIAETCPAPVEQAIIRPLPHCGDWCPEPGAAQGCINWQGHRTQCYCSSYNNTWTCGPY